MVDINYDILPIITTVVQAECWGKGHIARVIICPKLKPPKHHKIIVGTWPKQAFQ